jgi:glutathione S-transferase
MIRTIHWGRIVLRGSEASRRHRRQGFCEERIPKYFAHFETALGVNPGSFCRADGFGHVDTSLFQLVEGLRYAFPRRMAQIESDYPRIFACRDAVAKLPGIIAYLASDRRIPFNEDGIFRHYLELDAQ